ncbi:hypothetical protein E2C01_092516 [Portunus trituberculatus]|uniref:Uncharacterized protein n=1 Tax=Portunus trituberculatus TaxID=210409 RepID=A0A5B7JRL1_PORTR|nr:hypothetical protein [Portunus trituberculatus]
MHAPPRHEHSQELTRGGRSSPAPGSNRRLVATRRHTHSPLHFFTFCHFSGASDTMQTPTNKS